MFKDFILQFKCQSCKKRSELPFKSLTRNDLESSLGSSFQVGCEHCAVRKEYHVNDVKAIANPNYQIVGILFLIGAIIFATLLLMGMGYLSLATFVLPIIFYLVYRQSVEKSITLFNKTMVSRDRNYEPKNKKIL